MTEKDYTIELNEFIAELESIDNFDNKVNLRLENAIKRIKKFIKSKCELLRFYTDKLRYFEEFSKTKQYSKMLKIISNYIIKCVDIYKNEIQNTVPKFKDDKNQESLIKTDILDDYKYSLFHLASSYWLIEFIIYKKLDEMLNDKYDGIISFYSSITSIILSNYEKSKKIDSLLYSELLDNIKNLNNLKLPINIYAFEQLALNKKHSLYDSHAGRILCKSIAYSILSKLNDLTINPPARILMRLNNDDCSVNCGGNNIIKFEPNQYKIMNLCLDEWKQKKQFIDSTVISKINAKFVETGFPKLFLRKNAEGIYQYDRKNYDIE